VNLAAPAAARPIGPTLDNLTPKAAAALVRQHLDPADTREFLRSSPAKLAAVGIVAMVLALRLLPPPKPREGTVRSQIDVVGALLLGLAVLAVLLPIIDAMARPATPLWFLVLLAPVLGWAFVRWEHRVMRRQGAPLLDVSLFSQAPGYASGIVLGSTYFCGFAGVWLVLALYLQDGLGYTPLQSGLAVTPFAVGSAAASITAGRLVGRRGRAGLAASALELPLDPLLGRDGG